ncbi:spidroin-1-like isoform X2 [Pipra filicauda]|uniref:Spidroin-1-like isoform X2 n=1 Tax=Pipra filicauda TaxID=649802 RepID=A0A7R5KP41_9PASS|nr:spidroin-1-like isoform X2 [Pipra filicauda]
MEAILEERIINCGISAAGRMERGFAQAGGAPSSGRLERAGRATEGRGAAQPPAGALGTPLVGLSGSGSAGLGGSGGSESTGLRVRGPPPPAWVRGEWRRGRGSRGAGTATQPGRAPASRSGDIDRPGCRRGSPRIPSPLSVRARQGRAASPGAGNGLWERRGEATPRRGTSAEEGGGAEMPLLITRASLLPWVSSSL